MNKYSGHLSIAIGQKKVSELFILATNLNSKDLGQKLQFFFVIVQSKDAAVLYGGSYEAECYFIYNLRLFLWVWNLQISYGSL